MNNLALALDAMGGDRCPQIVVKAAVKAVQQHFNLTIFIVGHSDYLKPLLQVEKFDSQRLKLIHAEQIVDMGQLPLIALRQYTKSSMRIALDLVQSGQADACISAGNTGALMAMSKVVLRTLSNIDRPALIAPLPTINNKKTYLLDIGANASCSAETLYQFALMGSLHAQTIDNTVSPKVALLNIGIENIKGNAQVQEASQYLQECPMINYVGFIEGDKLFSGEVDVIVCDGFVGNIALKTSEGIARLLIEKKTSNLTRNLFKYLFKSSHHYINPEQYNGASFIGLKKVVVKSHGNANEEAFYHAIKNCMVEVQKNSPKIIEQQIQSILI